MSAKGRLIALALGFSVSVGAVWRLRSVARGKRAVGLAVQWCSPILPIVAPVASDAHQDNHVSQVSASRKVLPALRAFRCVVVAVCRLSQTRLIVGLVRALVPLARLAGQAAASVCLAWRSVLGLVSTHKPTQATVGPVGRSVHQGRYAVEVVASTHALRRHPLSALAAASIP